MTKKAAERTRADRPRLFNGSSVENLTHFAREDRGRERLLEEDRSWIEHPVMHDGIVRIA